jgi:hypothetical protein
LTARVVAGVSVERDVWSGLEAVNLDYRLTIWLNVAVAAVLLTLAIIIIKLQKK